jgi:hypothetical protein
LSIPYLITIHSIHKLQIYKLDLLNRIFLTECLHFENFAGSFDVYNIETAMPNIDMDAIESHLKAAREEERRVIFASN